MSKPFGELLVEGKNLVKDFPINSNALKQPMMRAINDVSFKMYKSRGLSVVGESGSGKSTTAKMIAKMYAPTSGEIEYKGRDIQTIKSRSDLMHYREGVQMVWQDPFGSLNPTHTIFHHIARPLLIHKKVKPGNKKELQERVYDLLEQVGLIPPKRPQPSIRISFPAVSVSVSIWRATSLSVLKWYWQMSRPPCWMFPSVPAYLT